MAHPGLLLCRLSATVLSLPGGNSAFLSHHHLKVRFEGPRKYLHNIILVQMEAQDAELGSTQVMNKSQRTMQQGGARLIDALVTTPRCCPSCSSFLSRKCVHSHNTYTDNEGCSLLPGRRSTRAAPLLSASAGRATYRTAFSGKYLKEYNGSNVPPGWKQWVGLLKSPAFITGVCQDRVKKKHGFAYSKVYSADVIINDSVSFFHEDVPTQARPNGHQPRSPPRP